MTKHIMKWVKLKFDEDDVVEVYDDYHGYDNKRILKTLGEKHYRTMMKRTIRA